MDWIEKEGVASAMILQRHNRNIASAVVYCNGVDSGEMSMLEIKKEHIICTKKTITTTHIFFVVVDCRAEYAMIYCNK